MRMTAYMNSKHMRKTPERYAILDMAQSISGHFDAAQLKSKLDAASYHVSHSTVYSTLKLLEQCGLAKKHQFGSRQARYELVSDTNSHNHLVCIKCGKIKDVKEPEFDRYINAKKYPAFTTENYELTIYGVCSNCSRKQKRRKTPASGEEQCKTKTKKKNDKPQK